MNSRGTVIFIYLQEEGWEKVIIKEGERGEIHHHLVEKVDRLNII